MNPFRLERTVGLLVGLCVTMIAAACAGGTPAGVVCDVTTQVPTLTIGVTASGAMEDSDCTVDGDPGDVYRLSLTSTTQFSATVASDKISPQIFIEKNTGTVSEDADVVFSSGKPAKLTALLPAGEYIVEIQSDQNAKGPYTLTTASVDGSGCAETAGSRSYIVTGMTVSGAIAAGDCTAAGAGVPQDAYYVKLRAGQAYSATVNSTLTNVHFELSKDGVLVPGSAAQSTTGKLTANFTPTATGYHRLAVTSANGALAAYTLTVTP